nr:hypothetical protein [Tanacetum cinerariifolium]
SSASDLKIFRFGPERRVHQLVLCLSHELGLKEVRCFRCSVALYPLSPQVPFPSPAVESEIFQNDSFEYPTYLQEKRRVGEEEGRGAFVLTLESVIRLSEYRTMDLLSIIAKHSRGILSKQLQPAAESKAS